MDMGQAVGKEYSRDAIPEVKVGPEGVAGRFHKMTNSVIMYNFFGREAGIFIERIYYVR
jgi:hypothetical protein